MTEGRQGRSQGGLFQGLSKPCVQWPQTLAGGWQPHLLLPAMRSQLRLDELRHRAAGPAPAVGHPPARLCHCRETPTMA